MIDVRRGTAVAVCLLALGPAVAGCGGAGEPAVCDDVDALSASIEDLRQVEPGDDMVSTLRAELDQVQDDLSQLRDDASEEYSGEIDALAGDLDELRAALESGSASPSAASLNAIATAVRAVGGSLTALQDAASGTCE